MAGFGTGIKGGKKSNALVRLSHGGYSYLRTGNTPPCRSCLIGKSGGCPKFDETAKGCAVALEAMDDQIGKIMRLPWIRPIDMPVVEAFVRNWIFIFIVDKWLSIASSLKFDDEQGVIGSGIFKQRWVAENAMLRAATALGLTPESRKNLGLPLIESDEIESLKLSPTEEKFRSEPVQAIAAASNGKESDDSKT